MWESPLYARLKPYHIQQDTYDGCSAASALMILNAIRKTRQTQAEFRQQLIDIKSDWVEYVNGQEYSDPRLRNRHGVASARLFKFLTEYAYLTGLKIDVERNLVFKKPIKYLKELVYDINMSSDRYLIFNWNAHHSPLGNYDLTNMMILNCDAMGRYEREFIYEKNHGEKIMTINSMHKLMKAQDRSVIIITDKTQAPA